MARKLTAALLITAGLIWCVLFPKRASFDPDMVLSVCLGIGLIASGALLWRLPRMRPFVAALAFGLLWSVLGNAYLWSESNSAHDSLQRLVSQMQSAEASPR